MEIKPGPEQEMSTLEKFDVALLVVNVSIATSPDFRALSSVVIAISGRIVFSVKVSVLELEFHTPLPLAVLKLLLGKNTLNDPVISTLGSSIIVAVVP